METHEIKLSVEAWAAIDAICAHGKLTPTELIESFVKRMAVPQNTQFVFDNEVQTANVNCGCGNMNTSSGTQINLHIRLPETLDTCLAAIDRINESFGAKINNIDLLPPDSARRDESDTA